MIGDIISNTRRNHALEHATVSLLISKLGPTFRVVGRASGDGFFLYGDIPPEAVAECVNDALVRLKRGEGFWAVTPLCGTNLATAGVLASLSTMAVLGDGDRKGKMSSAIVAGIIAVTLAQPLGRIIQRYITTSPDLQDTEIVSIESRPDGRFHKVKTRRLAGIAA
jgi:hypothetical protein